MGVVGRAHGVRGEVVVQVRTAEPDRRVAPGQQLRVENASTTFTVTGSRDHSGRLLVTFAEVADRTAAEAIRGTRLVAEVDPAELPEEPGAFYDRQLIGLTVRASGVQVGVVSGVLHLPMQDLLEVRTNGEIKLVPFVSALVPEVDLAAGTLTVTEVAGLLDEDAE